MSNVNVLESKKAKLLKELEAVEMEIVKASEPVKYNICKITLTFVSEDEINAKEVRSYINQLEFNNSFYTNVTGTYTNISREHTKKILEGDGQEFTDFFCEEE